MWRSCVDELGVADNTRVVFFSDNGGSGIADNTPLRGGKSQMFEDGLRVPFLVRWPDVVPAGSFSRLWKSFPRSFESPAPSVLATIPILTGQCESPHEEMFWERRGDRAARVGHWKWVQSQRGTGLFDLSHDVGERNDLSGQRPDMLKHLKARFAAWKESMEQVEPRGPFRDF